MRPLRIGWPVCIAVLGALTAACDLSVIDPAEILVSPADGAVLSDNTPDLEWYPQQGASQYQVQVDDDDGFGSPEVQTGSSTTHHMVADPLPPGTYHWRIRALIQGRWSTWSQSWSFTIQATPPATPILSGPSDGSSSTEDSALLEWSASAGALVYRVQLDDDAAFASPEVDSATGSTSLPLPGPLPPATYYWRVLAQNGGGDSPWSETWSFTVEEPPPPPEAPTLLAPANGASSIYAPASLDWNAVDGSDAYRVQLDDDPGFGSPEIEQSTAATSQAVLDDLEPATYYWRVQATNEGGPSDWSETWSFAVEPPPLPPDPPTLLAPADGASSTDPPGSLTWEPVEEANGYRVQLDDDPSFGSPQADVNTLDSSWPIAVPLDPDTYYWRVQGENDVGPSEWSAVRSFSIEPSGPVPGVPGALGVLGSSKADEYRADDNRGGAYGATTFNWVELLARYRGVDVGPWGFWGEPRRTGYEYNWARSGATASSLISSGQHTGLAQQIAAGEVQDVVVDIGYNDFRSSTYADIYNGDLSGGALQQKIDDFVADLTEVMDTLFNAGSPRVLLALLADPGADPGIVGQFPDAARRQLVTDVIDAINVGLRALAQDHGIPVWDPNELAESILAQANPDLTVDVGGESIDLVQKGNEPHHARLDDSTGHAGTVFSGLIANSIYMETFSNYYGLGLTPFSDAEILSAAGIN